MQTFDNIFSRRSIRKFNAQEVTEAEIMQILKAGYAAPVGRNLYNTLHISVISNKDFLARWEALCAANWNAPQAHPFYGAPVVVLISSVVQEAPLHNVNFSNAACVAENMGLAAVELGIGTCHVWNAVREIAKSPEMMQELNIPEGMMPCCSVILGHTDETYAVREIPENKISTAFHK